jgi:hypothetical protein
MISGAAQADLAILVRVERLCGVQAYRLTLCALLFLLGL